MQVTLGPEDKYLVFCSDGIFEFMDNEHIMSIVDRQAKSGWSPSDIAKCLVCLPPDLHTIDERRLVCRAKVDHQGIACPLVSNPGATLCRPE